MAAGRAPHSIYICAWNKNFISPVQDKHIHFMIHKILPYPITKCWHEYSHVQVRCKVFSHKRRFCRHVRLKSIEYPLSSSIIKKKNYNKYIIHCIERKKFILKVVVITLLKWVPPTTQKQCHISMNKENQRGPSSHSIIH